MSRMDKFPEMKGFYVIIDDASIRTSNKVQSMIEKKEIWMYSPSSLFP